MIRQWGILIQVFSKILNRKLMDDKWYQKQVFFRDRRIFFIVTPSHHRVYSREMSGEFEWENDQQEPYQLPKQVSTSKRNLEMETAVLRGRKDSFGLYRFGVP